MKKKLYNYGGQGYSHSKENGKFEVRANETKKFTKLSKAKEYYESLDQPKAIWDLTTIPELIDCHAYQKIS